MLRGKAHKKTRLGHVQQWRANAVVYVQLCGCKPAKEVQTKQEQLKVKWALFVRVLTRMKAVDQSGEPDSVLDYTTLWSNLIDQGGLYHIND